MLYENIKKLVEYGIQTGLTPECERIYTTYLLLELFEEDSYEVVVFVSSSIELVAVLEGLLDEAVKRGIIEDSIGFRDLFDTKIMGLLMPRPSEVIRHFHELYEMEKLYPRVKNYNVSVREVDQKVIFLRKLERGGSEHSLGIHVAKLAGMPKSIV